MSASDREQLKIFAGSTGRALAQSMCDHLELPIGQAQTVVFPDGELLVKLDEDVRGRDCYIVQSCSDPVNQTIMELLVFIDCLRRASARRITAVIPYFGYARQDRKDEGRVPITAKLRNLSQSLNVSVCPSLPFIMLSSGRRKILGKNGAAR